jgi:hypothetical protein
MERREFIKSIFRNIILTGILLFSGYLIFREKSENACEFDFICKNCKKLSSCDLPEAEQAKTNL